LFNGHYFRAHFLFAAEDQLLTGALTSSPDAIPSSLTRQHIFELPAHLTAPPSTTAAIEAAAHATARAVAKLVGHSTITTATTTTTTNTTSTITTPITTNEHKA
jgi:hypothetical protein